MKILVVLRMVPDVVEELEIRPDGKTLDSELLRMILSESDDHALEEALLLKERHGGSITVVALEAPELDDALYAALAKGADRAIKIEGLEPGLSTCAMARALAGFISGNLMPADLILTGTQAFDDLDGLMAPLLSHHLGLPHLGIVTAIQMDAARGIATVVREYSGGVRGEFEVSLPAVVGIQAAEKPPRYVPVAKIRVAMKSGRIEAVPAPAAEERPPLMEIVGLKKCEAAGHAEMLEGTPEDVSQRLVEIFAERGLV